MGTRLEKWRYALIMIIILVVTAVFCARLFQWQIRENVIYEDIALTSTEYTIKTDAVRGEIFDVNGVPLAQNQTGYKITINKIFTPDDKLNDCIHKLITLTEKCGCKWFDELPIKLDGSSYVFEEKREADIEDLKSKENLNMNPYSTAEECMARLIEKYDCKISDKKLQHDIISVRYNMDKNGYSRSKPYVFSEDLDETSMNIITENVQSYPGVEIIAGAVRKYVNGKAAPHLVGVTGLISAEEYDELEKKGYAYNDYVGKLGIEYAYEDQLKGKEGSRTYEVSPDGTASLKST